MRALAVYGWSGPLLFVVLALVLLAALLLLPSDTCGRVYVPAS